ncbi:unnamed protein product, partial [Ectocarpus fasciculatus]
MASADEPSSPRRELGNSDSERDSASSSEDEPLFKFPDRGAFKRKVEKSDSDDDSDDSSEDEKKKKEGEGGDDSESEDEEDFFSSLRQSRAGGAAGGGGGAAASARGAGGRPQAIDLLSDSDDEFGATPRPAPKRRKKA